MNFVIVRDEKGVEKEISAEVWRLMKNSKEKGDTRKGYTIVKGKIGPLGKAAKMAPAATGGTTANPGFEPDDIKEKVKAVTEPAKTAAKATTTKAATPAPAPAASPSVPAPQSEPPAEDGANADPANSEGAPGKDDLTKIQGIGPKVVELFQGLGIVSYKDLVEADPVKINEALDGANLAPKKAQVVKWKMEAQELIK